MNTDFVIVTSLYNLKKVKRDDNRDWEDYLKWFGKTLKIKCPFIIFTEDDTVDFINSTRENLPTHIITSKLEDVPLYNLKTKMQEVLDSEEYKAQMQDSDRIECKESIYSVIQYSKFKWLKTSCEINPFDSKYFFWLDAGASRFLKDEDLLNQYPSTMALEQLSGIDNTFLLQYNPDYYPDLVNADLLLETYFYDNRSFICGSMFGGNSKSIEMIDIEMDIILEKMISNKCINNEQIALGYLCKNRPDLFTKFYRKNPNEHLSLFQEMA